MVRVDPGLQTLSSFLASRKIAKVSEDEPVTQLTSIRNLLKAREANSTEGNSTYLFFLPKELQELFKFE